MSDSGGANVCLGDSLPHISFIFPFSSSFPGLFAALVALIFQLLLFPFFFCVSDDDALVKGVCWKFFVAPSASSCTYTVYQTFPVEHELAPSCSTRHILHKYVARPNFQALQDQPDSNCDCKRENQLLFNQDSLLYALLALASNQGAIGLMQDLLWHWVPMFQACGKHKYATHLSKFLQDL